MQKRADRRRRKTAGGFTLVEVLLVIVIILIATGVAVPRFRGAFQHTQMQDASRSVIRMARFARSMAIARQQPVELSLGTQAISLTLPGAGTNQSSRIDRRLPDDITIDQIEGPSRTRLRDVEDDGRRTIRFYPTGMNDGFEITLRDARGRRVQITCHPITGKTVAETLP